MSDSPPAKRVRKGTKSCVECRQRKIRCVWSSEEANTCRNCLARNRTCQLQTRMLSTSEGIKSTSRARIESLEETVSVLWTAVRQLENKLDYPSSKALPQLPTPRTASELQQRQTDDDIDSESSDLASVNPATHILQLFDNGLLGSADAQPVHDASRRHALSSQQSERVSALRRLLPSREDMLTITEQATSWLQVYNALFPMISLNRNSAEMLSEYDKLYDSTTDPETIAAVLLAVAITLQQAPNPVNYAALKSIQDRPSYVNKVSETVERLVVSDDSLAGTFKGLETCLVFIRLQLGRATVRKTWLLLRRIIALAEMCGLHRAAALDDPNHSSLANASRRGELETSQSSLGTRTQKAALWESICALDRMTSMMWSLPLATANHPVPKRPVLDNQGQVISHAFMYRLTDIASRVLDLDNMYSSEESLPDLLGAVMMTDQELRALAKLAPKEWWDSRSHGLSAGLPLQCWHHYITIRTHIRLALAKDDDQQFTFSLIACVNASQELLQRYIHLRPQLPAGFFANRFIDLQGFTATIALLLISYRAAQGLQVSAGVIDTSTMTNLLDETIRTMKSAALLPGENMARQASDSIVSLRALLQQTQASKSQDLTLNLPLVGKIHVRRKANAAARSTEGQSNAVQDSWRMDGRSKSLDQPTASSLYPSNYSTPGHLSYSMEIPEDAFQSDGFFGIEPWLSWDGWDGQS